MAHPKKNTKIEVARKSFRPLLALQADVQGKLGQVWRVLKRELKIPDIEEIIALKERTEFLEKKISSLRR